ncbi:MAG: ABC transporter permease [Ignavibacteria bacterium]
MIKNYIKVALRNLLKYKGYSFINILGLAIGITCCLLILLFVQDELSYDRFHKKAANIYRIGINGALGTNQFQAVTTAPPVGKAMVQDYPEILAYTKVTTFGFPVMRYKDKVFSEEKFYWADSNYFDLFTVEFLKGNPKTALIDPNTVVITERMAKKYFGNEDPMGKSLNSDNRIDYKITGIVKEYPHNSHFHFDFLGSMYSYNLGDAFWLNNNFNTYILLRKDADPELLESKFKDFVRKYIAPYMQSALNLDYEDLIKKGGKYEYFLQPLTDIHLHSDYTGELEPNSDISYVYVFSFIAVSILLIACINFTNLSTARSSNRTKEIGVRKTLGSSRQQLVKQFLTESVLMTLVAVFIAVILIEITLPYFNNLIGKNLSAGYLSNFFSIPSLIFFILLVGSFAGAYPAIFLSSFNPVKVLKKNISVNGKNSWLRNLLVVVQFAVSIALFIGTIIVYNQLEYISGKKLGFNKDQIIVVEKTDDIGKFMESFRTELLSIPGVKSASNSTTLFGKQFFNNTYRKTGSNDNRIANVMYADYNLASAYELQITMGRYYSQEFGSDSTALVLNESAVKEFGVEGDPIGQQISNSFNGDEIVNLTIIGVVKDFHYESLKQKISPLIIRLFNSDFLFGKYVSVKVTGNNIDKKLQQIKSVWHKFAGNQAFEYFFFDEDFAKLYTAEKRTSLIVAVFSVLAIFIACLGLLGLAAFTTEQRTKEVGIRKILGATVPGIILLLSKDFTKWVIIANLIAWPAAYFVMNKWLEDFAYRINIPLWSFVIAGVSALVIALITVSYQALKAAVTNPVKSLRYE